MLERVVDAVVAIYGVEVLVGRVLGILVTPRPVCVGVAEKFRDAVFAPCLRSLFGLT